MDIDPSVNQIIEHQLPQKCFNTGWKEYEVELMQLGHLNFIVTKNTYIKPQTGRARQNVNTTLRSWEKDQKDIFKHKYFTVTDDGYYTPEDKKLFKNLVGEDGNIPEPVTFKNNYVMDKEKYGPMTEEIQSYTDWIQAPTTKFSAGNKPIFKTKMNFTPPGNPVPFGTKDIPIYQTNHRQAQILYPSLDHRFENPNWSSNYRSSKLRGLQYKVHGSNNKYQRMWNPIQYIHKLHTKSTGKLAISLELYSKDRSSKSKRRTIWDTRTTKKLKSYVYDEEATVFHHIYMDLPENWPDFLYMAYNKYCFRISSLLDQEGSYIFECLQASRVLPLNEDDFTCVGKDTLVFSNGNGFGQLTLRREKTEGYISSTTALNKSAFGRQ